MRRPPAILAAVFAASLPQAAAAGSISITEFGSLTRITIPKPPADARWSVDRKSNSVKVVVNRADTWIKPAGISPESRVTDMSLWKGRKETGIEIEFTCDCTTQSYSEDDRTLIVDIAERGSDSRVTAAAVPAFGQAAPPRVFLAPPAPVPVVTSPIIAQPMPLPYLLRPPLEPRPAPPPRQVARTMAPIEDDPAPARRMAPVEDDPAPARRKGIEPAKAITFTGSPAPKAAPRPRARTQANRAGEALAHSPLPRPNPRPRAAEGEDAAVAAIRDSVLNQLVEAADKGLVSFDHGRTQGAAQSSGGAPAALSASCPSDSALNLVRLSDTSDFREPLGELRQAVFDDMKQISADDVRALARHYLAFGLGAEVRNIIAGFETSGPAENLLLEMAAVIDGPASALENASLMTPDCGPRAAVWRAAALAQTRDDGLGAAYEATRGRLFDLPDPLMGVLGGRIALGLHDAGEMEPAKRIWRALQLAEGPRTPEMVLLDAHMTAGSDKALLYDLMALAETRSAAQVEAALRAAGVLLRVKDDGANARLQGALDDLAVVYRGAPQERDLILAAAMLDARYGDLASALSALDRRIEADPEQAARWKATQADLVRSAMRSADPATKPGDLKTVLAGLGRLDASPDSDTARIDFAQRLIAAGAAHLVARVIPRDLAKRSPEARRLLAEAALNQGQIATARDLARGLEDEAGSALLDRAAHLDGDGARAEVEERFEIDLKPEPDRKAPLARARVLIEGAESDLTVIQELLSDG